MNEQHDRYTDELDELLAQVDALFPELREDQERQPADEPDFDPDDYTPEDARMDEPILYQNFSNRYGADVRNFSNGYGTGAEGSSLPVYNGDYRRESDQTEWEPLKTPELPVRNGDYSHGAEKIRIPVFNGDYRREPEQPEPKPPVPKPEEPKKKAAPKKKQPRKKRRGCCLGCAGALLLPVVLVIALAVMLLGVSGPASGGSEMQRKPDTSTILLVGTDAEGERTDTMMLLYLSGSEKRVGLLSLPRDTYTITGTGSGAKLNSAYVRNGKGEEGMAGLLNYVQEILGYRPDGYMMVSMDIVPRIVDTMGGLEVEVPMSFELEGVYLEEGLQKLGGVEVLQLLRYRSGYAMQDLGRIEVQRMVIGAAMEQWISPDRLGNALDALTLVRENCMTNLGMTDFAWIAKTILQGRNQIESHTLPGWADYIGDVSYYILDEDDVAELINARFNPFTTEITVEDLNIAG